MKEPVQNPMEQNEPQYFMVRAMAQTARDFDVFFRNSVVAVGWSRVNFSSFTDVEKLVAEVCVTYYEQTETAPQVIGKKRNEVRRFKRLTAGDRIVVPYFESICLATAGIEELYDDTVCATLDLSNQRRVEYFRETNQTRPVPIPRNVLSEGLQRRLRVRGTTVSNLNEFRDELDALWKKRGAVLRGQAVGWPDQVRRAKAKSEQDFKQQLLRNIQEGKTNLKAGGIGLEQLVKELLRIDGYAAQVLPKQRFPGFADADIEASRTDWFGTTKLLVQVKHHQGETDPWGAQQLDEIRKLEPDLYADYKMILITSAGASCELIEFCDSQEITLLTGEDLVEWIYLSMGSLKEASKELLGIIEVPTLGTERDPRVTSDR